MLILFENNITEYGMFKKHSSNRVIDNDFFIFFINNTDLYIYLLPVPRYQYAVKGENGEKKHETITCKGLLPL